MVKIYVIDTNVLIQNPQALLSFEDNQVILPVVVLEELDNLKKAEGEKGRNARAATRILEELRLKGNLLEGVKLESQGIVRVEKNYIDVKLPEDLPEDKMDNRIFKGLQRTGRYFRRTGGPGDKRYPSADQGSDHRNPGRRLYY